MESTLTKNRRVHERLTMELDVLCQTVGRADGRIFTGKTVDVSAGGALVELNGAGLRDGELLSVEMSVPPAEDLSEFGGRVSNYARVLRTVEDIEDDFTPVPSHAQRVAIEFCDNSRSGI